MPCVLSFWIFDKENKLEGERPCGMVSDAHGLQQILPEAQRTCATLAERLGINPDIHPSLRKITQTF